MAQRSSVNPAWYHFLKWCVRVGGVVYFRVRFSGRENVPREGAFLMVANHQSNLDPPLIGSGLGRRMNYLGKKSLFRFRPFGWLLRSVGVIPIDLEGVGLSGIKESLRRLKRGEALLIFPEGRRTLDGRMGKFLPGFTALAVRTGAPIVPAAIEGAHHALPPGKRFPRPTAVRVHYGVPLGTDRIKELDEEELVAEVERRVRACLAEIRRPASKVGCVLARTRPNGNSTPDAQ